VTKQAKIEGIALSYRYDIFGNMVSLRAGEYEYRYCYDLEGHLFSKSDNRGIIKTHTYVILSR
jgi:YD repeat-containing protein